MPHIPNPDPPDLLFQHNQVEFTGLLSRARLGHQHLTERDKELLTARVCRNHCSNCARYRDVMHLRPPGENEACTAGLQPRLAAR